MLRCKNDLAGLLYNLLRFDLMFMFWLLAKSGKDYICLLFNDWSEYLTLSGSPKFIVKLSQTIIWRGPGAVVKAACLECQIKIKSRTKKDCGLESHSGLQVSKNEMLLPRSLVKIQYCGELPWPRGSVLGLRPPGLKFRILCLEGSVNSPSSEVSPGPV